jgi:1-acyl-sn-glycerol-3-phosphate acyltransferase
MDFKKLRTLFVFIPLVTVYTIVCATVSCPLALVFRSGEPSHQVARIWTWLILKTCGVKVDIDGLDNIDYDRTYVFASNHQSLFDIPILFTHLPVSFRILFKQSLLGLPWLGWHLWFGGHIPVDRSNPVKARKSLERATEHIQHEGSIVVFPEGTRSRDGSIGRFKHGSFVIALRGGVPVVPVTISESWRIMERGKVTVNPRTVRVHLAPPIDVKEFDESSVAKLSAKVHDIIVSNYQEADP